jgi:2-polyprenyl-6-methoxyphenol hydroxylase-like FAD-dependent oxidoreductase
MANANPMPGTGCAEGGDTYDVIIVGARVAGAATAALLAQQGARVLLLERARFPAPIVSCPIFFGNSLAVLERIGVLDAVEAIGAPRIRYYGTRTPDFDLVARLPPSHGRDYAYAIRREVLDTVMLRCVQTYPGITVREGFTVTGLVWSLGQVVGVRGRQGGGAEQVFYARVVVGADGKRSLVARAVGAPTYARLAGKTCVFYAYYRDFAPLHEPSAVAYWGTDRRRGALVFDADAGLTLVSVGLPAEEFAAARKDPEATLEQTWRSIPELAARGRRATRATPVMGQGPVDSFYRQSYGPGWVLVGDAGHYIDPITGQGINNALRSAELFAAAWARAQRRTAWRRAMAEYQRQRDAETRPMYDFLAFSERLQQAAEAGLDLSTPLMRAIARQPKTAMRYAGIYSGATPVQAFFNPLNLARIMLADGLHYLVPQLIAAVLGQEAGPAVLRNRHAYT